MTTLTDIRTTDPATGRTVIITVCSICGKEQDFEWDLYNLAHSIDCRFHTDALKAR